MEFLKMDRCTYCDWIGLATPKCPNCMSNEYLIAWRGWNCIECGFYVENEDKPIAKCPNCGLNNWGQTNLKTQVLKDVVRFFRCKKCSFVLEQKRDLTIPECRRCKSNDWEKLGDKEDPRANEEILLNRINEFKIKEWILADAYDIEMKIYPRSTKDPVLINFTHKFMEGTIKFTFKELELMPNLLKKILEKNEEHIDPAFL